MGLWSELVRAYSRHVRHRPVEASILATTSYFLTLIVVRVFVTVGHESAQATDLSIAGVHIHHLVFGVLSLLLAGAFALDEVFPLARAVLFGIGAALVLDEFALLVFLKDVYWLPQGLLSVAAIAIGFAALIVNAWRGRTFVRAVATAIGHRLQVRQATHGGRE